MRQRVLGLGGDSSVFGDLQHASRRLSPARVRHPQPTPGNTHRSLIRRLAGHSQAVTSGWADTVGGKRNGSWLKGALRRVHTLKLKQTQARNGIGDLNERGGHNGGHNPRPITT